MISTLKNKIPVFFGIFLVSMLFVPASISTIEAQEDMIQWDKNRPLTWDDFQGEPDYSDDWSYVMSQNYYDASWGYEKTGSGCNYKFTEVDAVVSFSKNESWVKGNNEKTRQSLQYHQTIFNMMEVHAQKFENELLNNTFPCPGGSYDTDKINEKTNEVLDKIFEEEGEMVSLFAEESDYGINIMKHFEWNKKIRSLLGFEEESVSKEPTVSNAPSKVAEIPAWIKNNAGWWADGQIPDSAFLQGIQFLIKEGIMVIPSTETSGSSESQEVPGWIKNNAGWWAEGQIDDNAFVSGIQYLIKVGIIVVEQEQTQPSVVDKEIQKKADEHWDCFMGDRVPPGCVAWDEKYAIGGIEELTDISGYDVTCDTYCSLSLYRHFDVDNKLEKFQNKNQHKQLFDIYVSLTPKQILDDVVFISIITDDYGGKQSASVLRDSINPFKYTLTIDPIDMIPDGSVDELLHKPTMIHENAHILSLGSSQSDNDVVAGEGLYLEPYTELRKIIQQKTSACTSNYFTDVSGCMKNNSYLNKFFQKFWADIYSSHKWYYEFDDWDKFEDHNILIYKKYKTQFVTEYAASNPDEDFAESFTAFVLKEKPTKSTIADQKILFFYDFPELVEMRDFIRSNL